MRPGDGYTQQLACQNVGRGVESSHVGVLARRESTAGTLCPPQLKLDTLGLAEGCGRPGHAAPGWLRWELAVCDGGHAARGSCHKGWEVDQGVRTPSDNLSTRNMTQ